MEVRTEPVVEMGTGVVDANQSSIVEKSDDPPANIDVLQ